MNLAAESAAFKQRDATSYDAVSENFARFTARFSQPIAEHMADLAALNKSDTVLDVGTGTGVVAREVARRLGATGSVSAIDLSAGMQDTAKRLAGKDETAGKIAWLTMDAEQLVFDEAHFDTVLCLFALLHFPNPLAALCEMQRVLKPGGRLILAVGSRPPLGTPSGLIHAAQVMPRLARRCFGRELVAPGFLDALVHKHLPKRKEDEESALANSGPGRTKSVETLVRQAGFTDACCEWTGYNHRIDTLEEFWELQRTFSSLARKRIGEASYAETAALREAFTATCKKVQSRGGTLSYPVGVLLIHARKRANSWVIGPGRIVEEKS